MSGKYDTDSLEAFAARLAAAKEAIPALNADFMRTDMYEPFLDEVASLSPYESGDLINNFNMTETKRDGDTVRADFESLAQHASFVNYGTRHQAPTYFWERGMNRMKQGLEARYQEKFAKLFD